MAAKSGRTNFDNILRIVRENPETVFVKYGRMLSDLSADKVEKLRTVLDGLDPKQRASFFHRMYTHGQEEAIYNYAPIAALGVADADEQIRADSVCVLGYENDKNYARMILNIARNDPAEKPKIAAIEVLGEYMFEDSIDSPIPLPRKQLHEVLAELIEHKNHAVRRAAVVAFAHSGTKRVKEIISGFLAGNDREELISALTAVRLTMDEDWNNSVLELINDEDEEVRIAAIRAAGQLELREALPTCYELISHFDRISPELLMAAVDAVAEIGDESSADVLETLGEAAVDMDEEITEGIDDAIDTLNMTLYMGPYDDDEAEDSAKQHSRKSSAMLDEAIRKAADHCLSILEEKIPHDLEDDEAIDLNEDEDDGCDCGEEHHHHHHHHAHSHDNPLEGFDLSRFRILDDLEKYEAYAGHDEDEEELWAEFEDLDEEDLDADSLQDFINRLEKKRKK